MVSSSCETAVSRRGCRLDQAAVHQASPGVPHRPGRRGKALIRGIGRDGLCAGRMTGPNTTGGSNSACRWSTADRSYSAHGVDGCALRSGRSRAPPVSRLTCGPAAHHAAQGAGWQKPGPREYGQLDGQMASPYRRQVPDNRDRLPSFSPRLMPPVSAEARARKACAASKKTAHRRRKPSAALKPGPWLDPAGGTEEGVRRKFFFRDSE